MPRLLLPLLLLVTLLGGGTTRLCAEEVPSHFFFQEPADIGPSGQLREPGERIPVFMVHGFLKDDLDHQPKIHAVFSFLHNLWVKQVNRKKNPFEHVFPVHYRYRPDKSYADLGKEFAANVEETFGEVPCILFVHSAGATIARYAADAGLPVIAVIGLSPAHGGSPGASLMYGNRKLLEDKRLDAEQFRVVQQTLREIGVPDACARSLAWDNSDGGFTKEEIERYGIVVQPPLPPFRYDRFDHFGVLERFVAPFAGFDFLSNAKRKKKTDRQIEWELLGAFNQKWKHSDGVVIPYPRTAADGETKVWLRTYKGIGHREIFIDREVLERAWEQVGQVARKLLGVDPPEDQVAEVGAADPGDPGDPAPAEPPPPVEPPPPPVVVAPPPPEDPPSPEPTELALGEPDDLGEDLGDDLDDDLGGDLGDDPVGLDAGLGDDLGLDEDLGGPGSELEVDLPSPLGNLGDPEPPKPRTPPPPPDALAGVDLERVLATGLLPGRRRRARSRSWLRARVAAPRSGWDP